MADTSRRLAALPAPLLWLLLLALSAILAGLLAAAGLPASLLLGPMLAAIVLSMGQARIPLPGALFLLAQGVIACNVGRGITLPMLARIGDNWLIFTSGVFFAIAASAVLGWVLTRRRVLPGTTAVWGSSPGAATAMVILADAYGADVRMAAVMQYLRVVLVAVLASAIARIWGAVPAAQAAQTIWFPALDWTAFGETCAAIVGGILLGQALRIPGGAFLVPLVVGIWLQDSGLLTITLPPWFLAANYACIGWSIGRRFDRDIVLHAARALPKITAAILALIAACALFGLLVGAVAHVDPLTAYLATSPGGADSIAIIAASSTVDMSFVMAMQTVRFILVLLIGPTLARITHRRLVRAHATAS